MSKILNATCSANSEVTAEGTIVEDAVILSEGKQQSSGVLLMQGDKATYLTSSATDIKTTIEKLSDALDKIKDILQSIGAGMTGATTAPPPTLAADLTEIASIKTELDNLKEALK